jgi:hypothetical protein
VRFAAPHSNHRQQNKIDCEEMRLDVDARGVFFQLKHCRVAEISGFSQDVFGSAKAYIHLMKSLDVVGVMKFPADDRVGQGPQSVSIFVSVQQNDPPSLHPLAQRSPMPWKPGPLTSASGNRCAAKT